MKWISEPKMARHIKPTLHHQRIFWRGRVPVLRVGLFTLADYFVFLFGNPAIRLKMNPIAIQTEAAMSSIFTRIVQLYQAGIKMSDIRQ